MKTDHGVIQNLLTRDISTRDETTLLSGRGAGMGAVYQEVIKLGGRVTMHSEMHKGTELVIMLPDRAGNGPGLKPALKSPLKPLSNKGLKGDK